MFNYYQKYSVDEVIEQYELSCNEPEPEIDPDTAQETEMPIQLWFEVYNCYEFDDISLSRLVVESIVFPVLIEQIDTKFENDGNYKSYPGQIFFMMALDTCNTFVQRDIVGVGLWYDNLTLDPCQGEDITELTAELFNWSIYCLDRM